MSPVHRHMAEVMMALLEPVDEATDFRRTSDLLGGRRVLHRELRSSLETHDLLQAGLPTGALDHLVGKVALLKRSEALERALGISERTWYRHRKAPQAKPLSREQSGRVWKFAEVLARAKALLGSQDAAERWLEEPAMALDERRPIDLFSTPAGVDTLELHLTRLEYGVYT